MADVYLAKEESLIKRHVALKVLKPDLAKDPNYVKRFHREAQSAAILVQSNIVQIYEVNEIDGLHFIAQEYVQGRNLRQYIDRHGAVEPLMALTVLRQCALALQKAAEFNVVHRDIKPENILLSTSGEVKVTDFGLARVNNDASQQALTQIGITMGTPLYMSPEQVEGGSLDSRSDIYSLGVTAYHMLAGCPPFDGENALAIAVQQVSQSAIPLTEIRPDVPPELCAIVHQMICKYPKDRPQDATQLLKQLRKIKIDMDDGWEVLIEKLAQTESVSVTGGATYSESKLAATQQLQAVMRGNVKSWWKNPLTIGLIAIASVIGISAGVYSANQNRPLGPLDDEQIAESRVPKKSTVDEQYDAAFIAMIYATGPNDAQKQIEYWQAVIDYFPIDASQTENLNWTRLYHRRAEARLGEVYLSQLKLTKALEIYNRLESYEDVSSELFRITGTAGKAVVFDLMSEAQFQQLFPDEKKEDKIRSCLAQIGLQEELLNPFLRTRIEQLRVEYSNLSSRQLTPGIQSPIRIGNSG